MTVIRRKTKRHLMVFSGRAHPALADAVAADLGTKVVPTQAYEFANGEIYVRYEESVRGCDAFVIQSHTVPINEWIMERSRSSNFSMAWSSALYLSSLDASARTTDPRSRQVSSTNSELRGVRSWVTTTSTRVTLGAICATLASLSSK